MALAFRLYGKFNWPPTAAHAPTTPDTADGVVEIHYPPAQNATDAPRLAYLRWWPKAALGSSSDPADPSQHLFNFEAGKAADWFKDKGNADEPSAIWLDSTSPPSSLVDGTWLVFRGAFLLEQYATLDDQAPNPAPGLQWPLVTRSEYVSGKPVYSVLGICRKQKPLFYFNVHLPLPVRRTSLQGSSNINATAFPFSAVYDLAPRKPADWLRIDTLVAGWTAGDGLPDLGNTTTTSFPFKDGRSPGTMVLGKFDFAEYNRTPKGKFASYNRPTPTESQRFWPLNRQAVVQDILWPYGFDLSYDQYDWLSATKLLVADSSLRFPNRGSSIVYRATVVPYQNVPHTDTDQDLQTLGSGPGTMLRLRLADELGGRRTDGVQFGQQDTEDSEAKAQVEGWLTMGQTLSADCELSWDIAPDKIWSEHRDTDWSLHVSVRLHWPETVASSGTGADLSSPVTPNTQFASGLLREAGYSLRATRSGLESGEAGQPQSFLPDLANPSKPRVRFSLYGSPIPVRFDAAGHWTWGRQAPRVGQPAAPWKRPPMRLSLANRDDLIANSEDIQNLQPLKLRASKLTFFQQSIVKDGATFAVSKEDVNLELALEHDLGWPPQGPNAIEDGDPFFASFAFSDVHATTAWRGRLSSLQFSGSTKNKPANNSGTGQGYIRIGGRGTRLGLGNGAPVHVYPSGRIATELNLRLPAAWVEPIGVDVARNDRTERPAPLLISLNPPRQNDDLQNDNRFWLTATETLSPTQDRSLRASVLEDSQESGNRSYVVLSSEPFTIFRFTHQALYDRGDASNASVAEYSGDDRVWQYKRVSQYYHFILPPQAAGESADKPRRLEINDLSDDAAAAEMPPRPFLYVKDKDGNDVKNDNGREIKRRAVEFRLTPAAEIWISPSDVLRGYFMPESTSYEIFRQHGEYGLGAALGFLRAEFLYGLPVGIDVSKERSIARGARVAEIEALTGKLTGRAHETNAEARLSARWNALRSAVARRPERLEVWARDLDSTVDFTPARFSDGAQFALRHTALHRAPVIDNYSSDQPESEADYQSVPKVAGMDPAKVPTELAANPRHHPHGLSGGALWPVESLNLFKTLLRAPQSNGGAIESIALSPTGGDAAQKAEFLGGKVTIISETRNGYVQRQQVEVLGRICAFWHRAKHVVVYERTVNLPAQFAPKLDEDPKETRSRRPILRKVREYVELLQPERNYPDFNTAAQRSAGFLERVRFNSKIINVDSAWASDVDDYGWQIQLWNRLSARERPQVYPMPDVAFVSTCEGDGDKPVVAQECLDPDYLFFFADVSTATTADTDSWISRLDLDFPNMPVAQAIAEKADARSSEQPDPSAQFEQRRPAVSRILPGLRRFTWRLAPAAQKAAINAGRADKPVYAGLDSVSFMRATHTTGDGQALKPVLGTLLDTASSLARAADPQLIKDMVYWASDGTGSSGDALIYSQNIVALKKAIKEAIEKKDLTLVPPALTQLATTWNAGLPAKVTGALTGPLTEIRGFLQDAKFGNALQACGNPCDKLKEDAVGVIKRKEMLVRTALHDWTADAAKILPKLEYPPGTPIMTKNGAIEALLTDSVSYLKPLFQEAGEDVGRAGEGVEKARAVVINLENELDAAADRAIQRINQFVAGYDRTKPWSDDRRKAFHAGLRACASNIPDDVANLIDETRQHFASGLNDASQAIGGYLVKALGDIAAKQSDALSAVGSLKGTIAPYFTKAQQILGNLVPQAGNGPIDTAIAGIDKAAADINSHTGIDAGLKGKAKDALDTLRLVASQAKSAIAAAKTKVDNAGQMSDDLLNQAGPEINRLGTSLSGIVTSLAGKADGLIEIAKDISDAGFSDIKDELLAIWPDVDSKINELKSAVEEQIKPLEQKFVETGQLLDFLVQSATTSLRAAVAECRDVVHGVEGKVGRLIDDVQNALGAVQLALAPSGLLETAVKESVLRPALQEVLKSLTDDDFKNVDTALALIREDLLALSDAISEPIRKLDTKALGALAQVSTACSAAFDTVDKAKAYLEALKTDATSYLNGKVADLQNAFAGVQTSINDALATVDGLEKQGENLLSSINAFDHSVRGLQNDVARSTETARMYADRVFNAASRLDAGGLMAAPSNVLKLYSAVTSAPEIAALKADIDRIRSGFDELNDIVQTTKANALFNRLGDELKALGLSLPFDKIGDRLMPASLSDFDIGKVFRNFGGTKLDNLLNGYKIPAGVSDAVRVTHDFDKKQARAWVQVDIDAPMGGRRSLFSVGVFKADFVDMRLTGQVRLDASKDQDKVTETGYGRIGTTVDLVVGGQSMVRFEKFALNFTRESGLKIEFDPKNIRLNPSFKFIQDFLGTLFPDKVGGLQLIKLNGIPVGVQHDFALPPISLNFGTSGVSNISIENHFKLLAFPDFMLANRFNLSTIERPFIFSIFVIGGAGYIQIDAEYRPFDKELTVTVEAGAGGSASLAFAFGPFVGQVFIALSGTLSYRKVIGKPGGGLSISAVLVIAGHVDVAGIVTVGIVLMLRMTYRDDGQIDADGSLTVEIRISRFFKITAHANAKYKMRGGKSETVVSADATAEPTDPTLKKLQSAAKTLESARH
ncbi:hypothetical protein JIR23_05530 [Bradyrhizobium diazoefficiens]|nr:hypothetical protein [Bradyrhizobium diazoefficiens]QQN65261.1 hypothetical protein JIR23_05530 [Bradyrhizobium diazoefficiens]